MPEDGQHAGLHPWWEKARKEITHLDKKEKKKEKRLRPHGFLGGIY